MRRVTDIPTYTVYAEIKWTKYIGQFTAGDESYALEKAMEDDEADIELCRQCGYQMEVEPQVVDWIVEENG